MSEPSEAVVQQLRDMARQGEPVSRMFKVLLARLGPDIVLIMDQMRSAFHMSLAEVKPIAALSRSDNRDLRDEESLEALVMPAIIRHRSDWDIEVLSQP
jgi:hypothetical protein